MLVAVSLLAISLSFLIYQRPPSTWLDYLLHATRSRSQIKPKTSEDDEPRELHTAAQKLEPEPEPEQAHQKEDATHTENSSSQNTPTLTANVAVGSAPIPSLTLVEHESDHEDTEEDEDDLPPPSFPAMNSAQRASGPAPSISMPSPKSTLMAPPSRPVASSLMPPPRVAPSNLRALPNTLPAQSLRIPTTGPLPNRGPVPNRGPASIGGNSALAPAASATIKTPNARGKILLSPGHSPLDWANLQRSGNNLSGVDSLVRVTPAMLKEKNGRKGRPAWSSYQGKVYNISPYLPFHPGGEGELRRAAGKDGTKLFMEVHPWVNWENMLGECMVGIMVSEEAVPSTGGNLEDMD